MIKTPQLTAVIKMLEEAYDRKVPKLPKCSKCGEKTAVYTLPRWPDSEYGCRDELRCIECEAVVIADVDIVNSIISGNWTLYEGLA